MLNRCASHERPTVVCRLSRPRLYPQLLFVMTGLAPASLIAQVVEGRLVHDATSQPIASTTVQLLRGERGEQAAATGVTNEQGRFVIRAPRSGTYRLRSLRIGYQTATTAPFELLVGDVPLDVEIRLSAVAVLLAPLAIVSERTAFVTDPRLKSVGYYDRKGWWGREGSGFGVFLEREEIMRTNPSLVSDVLRTVRGVRVEGGRGRRQVITLRGHGSFGGTRCVPLVFIDGAPMATGADVDDILVASSLAAVEVYPGLTKPAEFIMLRRQGCGVIALWTGYTASREVRAQSIATAPPEARALESPSLALNLILSADSAMVRDSVWATLTITNLSDDSTSLCITDSRYSLRGSHTTRDMVERLDWRPCLHVVDLAPRTSRSWRELLALFSALDEPDVVLIQKHFRLREQGCGEGGDCEIRIRSEARPLTVYRDSGGV